MGYFIIVLLLLVIMGGIALEDKIRQEKKTPPTPTPIYPEISQRDFTIMAKQGGKKIKRITSLKVNGTKVYGRVSSQSKISEWDFVLDFGDIDRLTGQYTKSSGNRDSDIPDIVAKAIKEAILAYPNVTLDHNNYYAFCPCCGKRLPGKPGNFCPLCGAGFTAEA